MIYRLLLLPALIFCCALASCRKDTATELEGDWLFPIAKGDLSLNSLSELKNLNYVIDIPAASVGQPVNVLVSSPGIRQKFVGPFPVQLTDWIHRLDVDTLAFSGSLENVFPVPVGAGTKIVMRTSRDTINANNIAGSATIPKDVAPGERFSFDIQVYQKTLRDSVYFFLEDFNSPPYTNVLFTSKPAKLDITLKVLTASYVEIFTGKTYVSSDTTAFSAGDEDQISTHTGGSLNDTAASGFINVFAENGLPANTTLQIYFLDASKTSVLDSLFSPNAFGVVRGRTDGAGNPVYIASTRSQVQVNRLKLQHIRQAAHIVSRFRFNTVGVSGTYVSANRNPALSLQLTGDLKLNIQF